MTRDQQIAERRKQYLPKYQQNRKTRNKQPPVKGQAFYGDSMTLSDTQEVKAAIYNMSAEILMGKVDKKEIKAVVELARAHDLLSLVRQEFGDIEQVTAKAKP